MNDSLSADTVVLGVGNVIRSDDGVGVHAARVLQADARVPAGVTILDGGTLGLELIPYVSDASRVLVLDAVTFGKPPGTLTRMAGKELLGISGGWTAHQLGVADLIATLALVSTVSQDIVVLGVQPANTDWGTCLSPEIQAALAPLVDAAIAQLELWEKCRNCGPDLDLSAIGQSRSGLAKAAQSSEEER